MRKTTGKSGRGKETTESSTTTKGILCLHTFWEKKKTNQAPETQTKDGKNPANSYTLTHSSFVAEVKKRKKNLFPRCHITV